jgi:hypothetical protein
MRSDRQVVANTHRKSISEQVCRTHDQHDMERQPSARHACHDGKRRDEPVIGTVDELANVMTGGLNRAHRLHVSRGTHNARRHSLPNRLPKNIDDEIGVHVDEHQVAPNDSTLKLVGERRQQPR